jgi:septal ring factor EnvC (AmiA/AmiB activator)
VDTPTVSAAVSLIIGSGAVLVAAAVALIVGRRRGLDQVEDRADSELQKTLAAQDRRIALQDREIADLKAQVAALTAQVATLTTDLHTSDAQVRRLSALQHAQQGDGR